MNPWIKICGITREVDARAAIEAGADALGFILYPGSPRYVTPERAAAILTSVSAPAAVAVLVNPTVEEVQDLARRLPFTHFQLHGEETPEMIAALRPLRVLKALRLPYDGDLQTYEAAGMEAFLLDTPTPQHGGSGKTFDWNLIAPFRQRTARPLILSGGLRPDNVGAALQDVRPYGVDVSSGVEAAPGVKDSAKISAFIAACRSRS